MTKNKLCLLSSNAEVRVNLMMGDTVLAFDMDTYTLEMSQYTTEIRTHTIVSVRLYAAQR